MQQVLVTRLPHIAANRGNQETGEPPHVYPKKKIVLLGKEMVSYFDKELWTMLFYTNRVILLTLIFLTYQSFSKDGSKKGVGYRILSAIASDILIGKCKECCGDNEHAWWYSNCKEHYCKELPYCSQK